MASPNSFASPSLWMSTTSGRSGSASNQSTIRWAAASNSASPSGRSENEKTRSGSVGLSPCHSSGSATPATFIPMTSMIGSPVVVPSLRRRPNR